MLEMWGNNNNIKKFVGSKGILGQNLVTQDRLDLPDWVKDHMTYILETSLIV